MTHLRRSLDLLLPRDISTPPVELNEWGGRLLGQQYFPLYLGNGRDTMLIQLSGSGTYHWERPFRTTNPLSRLCNRGWYKIDRREYRKTDLVYGQLLPLVDFNAGPMLRSEEVVPQEVRQYFDPRTATLTTFFSQQDNRTAQWLKLRYQTWLTQDGLLVQTITCLEVPECGVQFFFSLGEVSSEYQNSQVPVSKPSLPNFEAESDNAILNYRARWESGSIQGFSAVGGSPVQAIKKRHYRSPDTTEFDQITAICRKGQQLWRIVSIQDDYEGTCPREVCAHLKNRIAREGMDSIRETHIQHWQHYFQTSHIQLPDPSAQFLYEVSRYVLKANLHPEGYLPIGNLPYLWQGAMFWDASFAHSAFLGSGNLPEAKSIIQHLEKFSEPGLALAKAQDGEGIRLEWTINLKGFSTYDPPCQQIHNNAVWAYAIIQQSRYSGNKLSESSLGLARELLRFLISKLKDIRRNASVLTGIDESHVDPKPYDTWTLAATLRALEAFVEYCEQARSAVQLDGVKELCEDLQHLLAENCDAEGVLQSFHGGRIPHWGSLIFDLFPDHPNAPATLSSMSQRYQPEYNLHNFHGLNRYAERAFPWATNWATRCLAKLNRKESHSLWLANTQCSNLFGGVPERVFYHGENYIDWCMTGHASQIWALHAMLAYGNQEQVTILGGIDRMIWSDLKVENLHAENGLKVSFDVRDQKVVTLTLSNLLAAPRCITVEIPHDNLTFSVTLPARSERTVHPKEIHPSFTKETPNQLVTP